MDDERIRQLTEEVLSQLRSGPTAASGSDLERRVAALEAAVAALARGRPVQEASLPATTVHVHAHPALRVLDVPAGSDRCVLEPDKPCEKSGACRVLGH